MQRTAGHRNNRWSWQEIAGTIQLAKVKVIRGGLFAVEYYEKNIKDWYPGEWAVDVALTRAPSQMEGELT